MTWRANERLSNASPLAHLAGNEFPEGAAEWNDPTGRREFLRVMAASLALAGTAACTRQPLEKIVPYVQQPELVTPGEPLHFATAHLLGGYARGVLVESHEGRPTKIEGNPDHPASLGRTDLFAQAAILDLYDPDRSQSIVYGNQPSSWNDFLRSFAESLSPLLTKKGAGLRILTETVTSPTFLEQMRALGERWPEMRWEQYEPFHRGNEREGILLAFGQALDPIWHFDRADVVVALDADFLCRGSACVRQAYDFAQRRKAALDGREMCRLFIAEPALTNAGAMADERWTVRAGDIADLAEQLLAGLHTPPAEGGWLANAFHALNSARGRGIVIAGAEQPPEVHALVHRLNAKLENVGKTVEYIAPADTASTKPERVLSGLADDLRGGHVELLLVLGGNPCYYAPRELQFSEALSRAPMRVHLAPFRDETSIHCQWHIPEAHFLETWSDARAFDGTASIIQPLIQPLFGGHSLHEIAAILLGDPSPDPYQIVRQSWQRRGLGDSAWRQALRKGVIEGTTSPAKEVTVSSALINSTSSAQLGAGLEIAIRPDPNVLDGRYANNAWLQELPRVFTSLSWDNAILASPALAERMKWKTGDILEIGAGARAVRGPVVIAAGHVDEAVTVHAGYGRTFSGRIGNGVGFSAYDLRGASSGPVFRGVPARKTGDFVELVFTQHHHSTEGRDILRVFSSADAMSEARDFAKKHPAPAPDETLFHPEEFQFSGYAWGMVIDLNSCIGCRTCMVACQAENNIPVVGKEEVARGRDMHWIRVDTYHEGSSEFPRTYFQPVPCMHCENAPCELVCPVGATMTDHEGLNVQVYNRCIGTRYCSNNCPYKVRRFNFLEYTSSKYEEGASRRMMRNPDVTVRTRGVMEKCTYCLQRITRARIRSQIENRKVRDGEIVPACAQACPADAITFGDLHDASSRVARLKAHPFDYSMLAELNTRPRTSYLARLGQSSGEESHA